MFDQTWNLRYSRHIRIITCIDVMSFSKVFNSLIYVFICKGIIVLNKLNFIFHCQKKNKVSSFNIFQVTQYEKKKNKLRDNLVGLTLGFLEPTKPIHFLIFLFLPLIV